MKQLKLTLALLTVVSISVAAGLALPQGAPALSWLIGEAKAREVIRMSPRIREYESAVIGGSLSIRDLRALIPNITIFDEGLGDSGELIDFFDSAMGRPGGRVEAAELDDYRHLSRFDIYTPCEYIDNPDGIRSLGCLSVLTAQATRVAQTRRTDILRIDKTFHGVFRGQRIVPRIQSSATSISELYRVPHPISGKIVSIVEGLAAGAQHRVVVVNLGQESKVSDGAVLTIFRNNEDEDPFLPDVRPEWRKINSNEIVPIGQVVIFDVFEKASLALVLRSEKEVSLNDFVRN